MDSLVFAAVLFAAAAHAGWNATIKRGLDPLLTTVLIAIGAGVVALPMLSFVGLPAAPARPWVVASVLIHLGYFAGLIEAYRTGDMSQVYPIARGSAPLLSVLVGLVLLGEKLAALQLVGVALLLLGILAVTMSQATTRATLPALLTGVAIAAYTSVDRVGVRLTTPWLYGWLLFALMAIELPITLWIAGRLGLHRPPVGGAPSWPQALLIGAFMWAGYFLVLWALTLAPLAIVAPVREVAVVAVAVWGVWQLGERRRARVKVAGAVATLIGIALLAT